MKNQVKTSQIKKYRANHRVVFNEPDYEAIYEHQYDVMEAEIETKDYFNK